jgi:AcrR family transcriptional regulator
MSDTDETVMCATCRALSTHGYANLTMQAIADEADVSTAALHYHYDSKRELLTAFQEFLGERFLDRVRGADTDGPADERLRRILDAALSPPETDALEDLQTALLELKAQAPYEPAFRERSRDFDAEFRAVLERVLADGVEEGVFRAEVDPERAARFLVTVLAGSQTRHVSVGQAPATTRELLRAYVESALRAVPEGARQEADSR